MNVLNIILYIFLFYSFYRLFTVNLSKNKGRQLIDIVAQVNHKDEFNEKLDELIATCGDPLYENKGRVIKLWGQAYHHDYEDFPGTAEELNVDALIKISKKGTAVIGPAEDSFFYLYLGIPNLLYGNDAAEQVKILQEKMAPYADMLSDQLVYNLGQAYRSFSENTDDLGMTFCQKLLEGDYGEYVYSKGLIGLYKMIANSLLAKHYDSEGTLAEHDELQDLLIQFANTGLGERWLKAIDLKVETQKEEAETFDMNKEASEAAEEPEETETAETEEEKEE